MSMFRVSVAIAITVFFLAPAFATTLIFDSNGNIVGSVAGTWGGKSVTLDYPVSKVGAAYSQGIQQSLSNRGFTSTDPRVVQTINSVSKRTATLGAAAGAGATWLSTAGSLLPVVTAGVLVYEGVNWYFDNLTSKTYLQMPGSQSNGPVFSNGISSGKVCWTAWSGCFGSPEEALSYGFSSTQATYPNASYGVPSLTQDSPTQYTAQYNYKIPEIYINNGSATKIISGSTWTGISCGAGYGVDTSKGAGCISAGLSKSPWANAPIQSYTPQQAYDMLPQNAKDAPLSSELASELLNRLWKEASKQPDYSGVPWSAQRPVAPEDFQPYKNSESSAWPKTSDLVGTPTTPQNPIATPFPNANQISTPTSTTGTSSNLGVDPGVGLPTLESPPTNLFKPISDLFQPWMSWQVPNHSAVCPTWQATPSISGHFFSIDLSYHCTFAEQYRTLIYAAALAGWMVIAVFIILSA